MYKISVPLLLLTLLLAGACARNVDGSWKAPLVYRIDVQQGNVVDQEMLDKLKPGMDKNQVKFVMGTPLIKDPFHSNRWDYIYIMEPGSGERKQRLITLYFRDDKLAYVEGDIKTEEHPRTDDLATTKDKSVSVPLDTHEEGFFSRMFDKNKPKDEQESSETVQDNENAEKTDTVTKATTEKPVEEDKLPTTQQATTTPLPSQKDTAKQDSSKTSDDDTDTIADKEQDKNLIRRFWDRITSGAEDSGVAKGKEETERDIRDAQVLEKSGGEL